MTKNFILFFLSALLFTGCQKKLNTNSEQRKNDSLLLDVDNTLISKVAVLQSMVVNNTSQEKAKHRHNPNLLRPHYVQRELFRELAKKVDKGSVDLKLQSFLETNLKIERHKFSYSSLSNADRVHLGNMLAVDALIVCEFYDGVNESDWIESNNEINQIKELVFYISMYDTKNGGVIWREKTKTSTSGVYKDLAYLGNRSIELLLKELPSRIERAQALEEITLL